ncbi:DUF2066 domain-containing protein [Granulosicoccaceae sp. 1_MG-2023]|nr:DUF2066 domain-containing protein [Granulosicoccaceae sp. 1_MG-2023]
MKFPIPRLLAGLILLSAFSLVQAQELSYEVAVSEQSRAQFDAAARTALSSAIVDKAGTRAALERPSVREALQRPADFVESYAYRELSSAAAVLRMLTTAEVRDTGNARYVLSLSLSPVAVDAALGETDRPVASAAVESSTLFWIVVEEAGQARLLGGDDDLQKQDQLKAVAAGRGVTAVLPVLDLQDRQALSVADVRGGFADKILAASARYGTDSVVTGVISSRSGQLWTSNWRRYSEQGGGRFSHTAADLGGVFNQALSWISQTALASDASRPALMQSSVGSRIWVANVRSVDVYVRISDLLGGIPGAQSAQIILLGNGGALFEIKPRLSETQLASALARAPWLRQSLPVGDPALNSDGPGSADLFYEYGG